MESESLRVGAWNLHFKPSSQMFIYATVSKLYLLKCFFAHGLSVPGNILHGLVGGGPLGKEALILGWEGG